MVSLQVWQSVEVSFVVGFQGLLQLEEAKVHCADVIAGGVGSVFEDLVEALEEPAALVFELFFALLLVLVLGKADDAAEGAHCVLDDSSDLCGQHLLFGVAAEQLRPVGSVGQIDVVGRAFVDVSVAILDVGQVDEIVILEGLRDKISLEPFLHFRVPLFLVGELEVFQEEADGLGDASDTPVAEDEFVVWIHDEDIDFF